MKILNLHKEDEFNSFLEELHYLQKILEHPTLELEDNETVLDKFEVIQNHFAKICQDYEKRISSNIDDIKIINLKTGLNKINLISQGKIKRKEEAYEMISDVINLILDFQRYLSDSKTFSNSGLRKLDIKPKDNATVFVNTNDEPHNIQLFASSIEEYPTTKRVFISYNYKDVEFAKRLHYDLAKHGIEVVRDAATMHGMESIESFIKNAIHNTDRTISVVSTNSLLSAWVALETIQTIHKEGKSSKKLIACAIDYEFFNPDFYDVAYDKISLRIEDISNRIKTRMDKGVDQRDLSDELTRNKGLLNNLDLILKRLKEYLTLDFREEMYEVSLKKLVESIQQKREKEIIEDSVSNNHFDKKITEDLKKEVRNFVVKDNIKGALNLLSETFSKHETIQYIKEKNKIVDSLLGQHQQNENEQMKNIIDKRDYDRNKSRIRDSILNLLDTL